MCLFAWPPLVYQEFLMFPIAQGLLGEKRSDGNDNIYIHFTAFIIPAQI